MDAFLVPLLSHRGRWAVAIVPLGGAALTHGRRRRALSGPGEPGQTDLDQDLVEVGG